MGVEAAGAAIAEPGRVVLLKLEWFLYCKGSYIFILKGIFITVRDLPLMAMSL